MADVPQIPPGWITYRYAAILDKFHLPATALAAATDYQLDALFTYPRTSQGALVPPKDPQPAEPVKPATDEDRLRTIEQLEAARLITPENATALRAEIHARRKTG